MQGGSHLPRSEILIILNFMTFLKLAKNRPRIGIGCVLESDMQTPPLTSVQKWLKPKNMRNVQKRFKNNFELEKN